MAITFATPLAQARALLNDPSGAIYADTPMIALGNKVYRELQTKMSALGIATTKEVSSAVDVAANVVFLGDGAGLPTDLLYPIKLYERADGSASAADWREMADEDWLPDTSPSSTLGQWQWREDEIKFIGATSAREVLIYYVKSLGGITATTSPILVLNSTEWIAQRLASLAALTLGSNPSRSTALAADMVKLWDDLRATMVKRLQVRPVRRRRTRFRVL